MVGSRNVSPERAEAALAIAVEAARNDKAIVSGAARGVDQLAMNAAYDSGGSVVGILADALTYARRLGCTHLVDAATLTGAIVVALGHVNTGVFTNNQDLLDKVRAAAGAEGEKMWPMPLDEEYRKLLESPIADLPNIGPRWGGAITAACFLKEFADPLPWVHLDIAGTAYLPSAEPFLAKGPTGVAVRSLARLVTDW